MTDTQREPKPGEWWEAAGYGPVLILQIQRSSWTIVLHEGRVRSIYESCFVRSLDCGVSFIAPAPPAKKLRAWTFEEAARHFNALFSRPASLRDPVQRPLQIDGDKRVCFPAAGWVSMEDLAKHWEYSADCGDTWQPCGVEESA